MKLKDIPNRLRAKLRENVERTLLPYPHVDVFFWRPLDGSLNFGDHLSRIVVEAAAATRSRRLDEATNRSHRMLGIGSVMHYAQPGDVVWGTGINGRPGQDRPGSLEIDVRAVRGPRTHEILRKLGLEVPEIFGDPALLLPRVLPGRFTPTFEKDVVFVPNLNDLAEHDPKVFGDVELITPYLPWNKVIERILSAKLVVSSSLHGIIVAEAYGVPARFVRFGAAESLFKYGDYYAGSGRETFEFATSVAQAIEMGGERPASFDADAMLGAFPFDLWND